MQFVDKSMFVTIAFIIYVSYPAPEFSDRLKNWEKDGHYLQLNNSNIFYIHVETDDAEINDAVIGLHGFPTFSYDWYKILPKLTKKFRHVVLLDFIGFGFSDKPGNHSYSIFNQADIVEMLLSQLNLNNVHLLAHDYGDTVAQELLARFSERTTTSSQKYRLHSVCLLNGGIYPETNHPRFLQKVLLNRIFGPVAGYLTFFYSFKFSLGKVFGSASQPSAEEYEDFWAAIRYKSGNKNFHKLINYIPERHANKERWVGVLKHSIVPVKIIYGPADPVNPSPDFVLHSKKVAPKVEVAVLDEKIGHYPQIEDPVNVVKEYFKFLESLKRIKLS